MVAFTDVSVVGRGTGLSFVRTYSSALAGVDGPLGLGWTDNYDRSLSVHGSVVTITQGNGSAITSTLTAPPGSGRPRASSPRSPAGQVATSR